MAQQPHLQTANSAYGGASASPSGLSGTSLAGSGTQAQLKTSSNLLNVLDGSPLCFIDGKYSYETNSLLSETVNATLNEPSISLNYSKAILWQIKYIVSIFLNRKTAGAASVELQYVSPPHPD